jgi:hypothetical protein
MRAILIKGSSAYDALGMFIDAFAQAFAAAGHEPIVIDASAGRGPDFYPDLERHAARGPIGLVFTFNVLGDVRDPAGRFIGDIVAAPHVVQFVDYPPSHLDRLEAMSPNAVLLTVDCSHVETILSTYGPDRFAHVGFSPHAAVGATVSPGPDPAGFAAARPIPILFPGTFQEPDATRWAHMPDGVQRIYEAAVEIALAAAWMPALAALDEAMIALGLDPADKNFAEFRKTTTFVHEYVRAHRRLQVLNTARTLGIPLHVVGKGYDGRLDAYPNLTFGGEVDFAAGLDLMARSRVVLNVNANFGAGSHERPLCGMNAGAAAASDVSAFYAANFKVGEEIVLYRWRDLEAGLAAVAELAKDAEAAFAMAQAGQRRVVAEHRWINRVETVIAAAEAARRARS